MTSMKNLKVGMQVRIKVGCPATKKHHGYCDEMIYFEGKNVTIEAVRGDDVSFNEATYTWHPDDIQIVVKEKKASRLLFNPEEIV